MLCCSVVRTIGFVDVPFLCRVMFGRLLGVSVSRSMFGVQNLCLHCTHAINDYFSTHFDSILGNSAVI